MSTSMPRRVMLTVTFIVSPPVLITSESIELESISKFSALIGLTNTSTVPLPIASSFAMVLLRHIFRFGVSFGMHARPNIGRYTLIL